MILAFYSQVQAVNPAITLVNMPLKIQNGLIAKSLPFTIGLEKSKPQ